MSTTYAPYNTKDAMMLLFELAAKEGRPDIIASIAKFMDLDELAYRLDSLVGNRKRSGGGEGYADIFTAEWRASLTRESYAEKDVQRLITNDLVKLLPGYLEFIQDIALGSDQISKHHFIAKLCSQGLHDQAMAVTESLESLDEIRAIMYDELLHYVHIFKNEAISHVMGKYGHWNRSTLKLLEIFEFDLSAKTDLSTFKGNDEDSSVWTKSRFEAQVDYVGETVLKLGINLPKLALVDGTALVKDAVLGQAFANGQKHALSLGGWHVQNFPNNYPAIAATDDLPTLIKQGAIPLRIAHDRLIESASRRFMAPMHAFESIGEEVSDDEVRLAMSLLGDEHIAMLRETIAPDPTMTVVLVPGHVPREPAEVPEELAFAVKYHRPEVLLIRGQYDRKISDSLDTRLYLKGVPSAFVDIDRNFSRQSPQLVKLKISTELHSRPELLRFFKGGLERERLADVFSGRNAEQEETCRLSLAIHNPLLSEEDNLRSLLDLFQTYRSVLGRDIKFRVVAPVTFFEYMASQKLGFGEEINYHIPGRVGYANSLSAYPRIRTALGEEHQANLKDYGDTPLDWVNKGVRAHTEVLKAQAKMDATDNDAIKKSELGTIAKYEAIKDAVAGMLDRIDIREVAKLATTPSRVKFLASRFDFLAVADQLPAKFVDTYITNKLEEDLGL